jgi:WD40 repeat protein
MTSLLLFISFHFEEASEEADALNQALAIGGVPVLLCAEEAGGDVEEEIFSSVAGAPLVIVMGTKKYGQETASNFSTYHQLRFLVKKKKPIFLIKMCDDFEEPCARLQLPVSSTNFRWTPDPANRSKVPDGLVRQIKDKLAALTSVATDVAAVVATASLKRKFPDDSASSAAVELAAPSAKQQVRGETAAAMVWKELLKLEGHLGGVLALIISSDGKRIVSGSAARYEESQGSTSDAEEDNESEEFVFSTESEEETEHNAIRMWDAFTGMLLLTMEGHDAPVDALAISLNGSRLVTGSYDMTIRVWDANTGEQLMALSGHASVVRAVAISPDGRRIVSGSGDNTIRLWDAHNGAQLMVLEGHASLVSAVAISPDGSKIVSGSWDATVRMWDLYTGAQLMVLRGHTGWVTTVAITHDGRRIASGSKDKTIRVWDANAGKQLLMLAGHVDGICSIAIFPDDKRIVSGSQDKTIRVWNTNTGEPLLVLEGHTEAVYAVAVFPDGSDKIVSGSADKSIRVWAMD